MEPEGVVDVLRHVLRALVPGGWVVDLASVPPGATVERESVVVGAIDESAFFPRAAACAAALDGLVLEGLLLPPEHEEDFPVLIHYSSGSAAVADVAGWSHSRMPDEVAARVRAVEGSVVIRETNRVRAFLTAYSK